MNYHRSGSGRAIAVMAGTAVAVLAITSVAFAATSPAASHGSGAARVASGISECTAAVGQDGTISAWVAISQVQGALGTRTGRSSSRT